jgi:hypothetical protein
MDRGSKKYYMQDGAFSELMEAAGQALAYERGARDGYRVVRVGRSKSPLKVSAGEAVPPKSKPSPRRKHKNAAGK